MAINPTTPADRIIRLLKEGASFVAIQRGEPGGVDVTHDIIGLLETTRENPANPVLVSEEALRDHRNVIAKVAAWDVPA